MNNDGLKQKIRDLFKKTYFNGPEDFVDVSDGDCDDSVHLVIVSRKFDGQRMKQRHDLISSLLVNNLTDEEWGRVSLSVEVSPEEIKAM